MFTPESLYIYQENYVESLKSLKILFPDSLKYEDLFKESNAFNDKINEIVKQQNLLDTNKKHLEKIKIKLKNKNKSLLSKSQEELEILKKLNKLEDFIWATLLFEYIFFKLHIKIINLDALIYISIILCYYENNLSKINLSQYKSIIQEEFFKLNIIYFNKLITIKNDEDAFLKIHSNSQMNIDNYILSPLSILLDMIALNVTNSMTLADIDSKFFDIMFYIISKSLICNLKITQKDEKVHNNLFKNFTVECENKENGPVNFKIYIDTLLKNILELLKYSEDIFDPPTNQPMFITTLTECVNLNFTKPPISNFFDIKQDFNDFLLKSKHVYEENHLDKLFNKDIEKVVIPQRKLKFLEISSVLYKFYQCLALHISQNALPSKKSEYPEFIESIVKFYNFIDRLIQLYPQSSLAKKFASSCVFPEINRNVIEPSQYNLLETDNNRCNFLLQYFDKALKKTSEDEIDKIQKILKQNSEKEISTISSIKLRAFEDESLDPSSSNEQSPFTFTSLVDDLSKDESMINEFEEWYIHPLESFDLDGYIFGGNIFLFSDCQLSSYMEDMRNKIFRLITSIVPRGDGSSLTKIVSTLRSENIPITPFYQILVDTLTECLKELVEKYLALTPGKLIIERLNIPMYSIVYMNDCVYMAYLTSLVKHILHRSLQTSSPVDIADTTVSPRDLSFTLHDEQMFDNTLKPYPKKLISRGYDNFFRIQIHGVQKQCLKEYITEYFGTLTTSHLDGSGLPNEKALKKCFMHLQHLKNVFHEYMPVGLCQRAYGILLDYVFEFIFTNVMAIDDITYACCEAFLKQFNGIIRDCLFKNLSLTSETSTNENFPEEPEEFYSYVVAKYGRFSLNLPKFVGLLLTLQKPMLEILNDWLGFIDSGTPSRSIKSIPSPISSPIARLSAPELRHLVRALFQNTEIRRNVLERIKD